MLNEVGMKLLLSPLSSNVVVRTACCSVGVALPVYSTFKAIEKKDHDEQQKWLLYWAAYGSFSIVEVFSDKVLSWFPMYHYAKFAFLIWLQLPSINGARVLYTRHLRPFLLRHQARLDIVFGAIHGQMGKYFSAYEEQMHAAGTLLMKIMAAGVMTIILGFRTWTLTNKLKEVIHPVPRQKSGRAIEGSSEATESSESDIED